MSRQMIYTVRFQERDKTEWLLVAHFNMIYNIRLFRLLESAAARKKIVLFRKYKYFYYYCLISVPVLQEELCFEVFAISFSCCCVWSEINLHFHNSLVTDERQTLA